MTMADEIVELVTTRKHVSFAELSNEIDGFSGEMLFTFDADDCSNIVLWGGVSKEAGAALSELINAKQIRPVPTSILTYMADGQMMKLPIAKRWRHYKKPRWLPVVFNPPE